jgi:hypothetical protein
MYSFIGLRNKTVARSLLDLRGAVSGLGEGNSRKGTSSCATAKLSLLV